MSKATALERLRQRKELEYKRVRLAAYLEANDGDFRFELAVMGLRAVLRKYSIAQLEAHVDRIHQSQAKSSVFGAGGGGGSGQFMVPGGVSAVNVTMIGAGGGGGSGGVGGGGNGGVMVIGPKHYTIKTP